MDIVELLLNPNVAFIVLWAGITLALLAILTPGSIILEFGALILLIGAGISMFFLEINYWALGIMALGVFFFIVSIRYPKQWWFLAIAIACLVVGSMFLYREENWWDPAVNPFLALTVSGLSSVFFWIVSRKVMEARSVLPTHDMDNLIGAEGEAKSNIYRDGSVQIGSELWSAQSETRVHRGAQVRVIGMDGFILQVEQIENEGSS